MLMFASTMNIIKYLWEFHKSFLFVVVPPLLLRLSFGKTKHCLRVEVTIEGEVKFAGFGDIAQIFLSDTCEPALDLLQNS